METYTKEQVVDLIDDLVVEINELNERCCFDELDVLDFITRKLK